MILLTAIAGSADDSLAALAASGAAILLLGIGALILDAMRRSQRTTERQTARTEEAVHAADGTSLVDLVLSVRAELASIRRELNDRISVNETRITDLSRRVGTNEDSAAAAHRRVDVEHADRLASEQRLGERVGALEQTVTVLAGPTQEGAS